MDRDTWKSILAQPDSLADYIGREQQSRLKFQGEEQQRKNALDTLLNLRKQQPDLQGRSMQIGEASIGPDYNNFFKQQQVENRNLDQSRLETKAVQDEANRLLQKQREQAQALAEVEKMMENPSSVTEGALRPKLARLHGEVGALAEAEQKRALPGSLKQDVVRGWNYITGQGEPGLTEGQREALRTYLGEKKKQIQTGISTGKQELSTRAPYLAPYLAKQGKLQDVMQGVAQAPEQMMDDRVKVISPDGRKANIPKSQLEQALKQGFRVRTGE